MLLSCSYLGFYPYFPPIDINRHICLFILFTPTQLDVLCRAWYRCYLMLLNSYWGQTIQGHYYAKIKVIYGSSQTLPKLVFTSPFLEDLESFAILPGSHPHFPVCQFSHQLFTNTSLSLRTFLHSSFRIRQLGGLFLVLISLWVSIPWVRSLPCIFPTGCISSKYLSGLKFIVVSLTARFLFTLSLILGVFILQFSCSLQSVLLVWLGKPLSSSSLWPPASSEQGFCFLFVLLELSKAGACRPGSWSALPSLPSFALVSSGLLF